MYKNSQATQADVGGHQHAHWMHPQVQAGSQKSWLWEHAWVVPGKCMKTVFIDHPNPKAISKNTQQIFIKKMFTPFKALQSDLRDSP